MNAIHRFFLRMNIALAQFNADVRRAEIQKYPYFALDVIEIEAKIARMGHELKKLELQAGILEPKA